MNKGYAYCIVEEWRLIISYYSGEITISDIKDHMLGLSSDPRYCSKFDTVNDFRDCNLNVSINEISEYIEYMNSELNIIDQRRMLFLTTKPKEVVITQLFADLIKSFNVQARIFTTPEAGLDWLSNRNIDYNTFYERIAAIREKISTHSF